MNWGIQFLAPGGGCGVSVCKGSAKCGRRMIGQPKTRGSDGRGRTTRGRKKNQFQRTCSVKPAPHRNAKAAHTCARETLSRLFLSEGKCKRVRDRQGFLHALAAGTRFIRGEKSPMLLHVENHKPKTLFALPSRMTVTDHVHSSAH